jgi:hypothetical protein
MQNFKGLHKYYFNIAGGDKKAAEQNILQTRLWLLYGGVWGEVIII